ncbi:MAG TPA: glycosyltransferase family 39 protein [Anaerolineales bacterium]
MKTFLRDLRWILPASLGLALALSLLGPGTWWIGWLAYAFVLTLGLLALTALWRSAGAPRTLMLMLLLALFLRLGLGMTFSYILPPYGNDTVVHNSGYIFRDAYTYDSEAWGLASSGDPLWRAFDKSYGSEDQYGGLLFFNGLFYRFLSPDAHRPWLIVLLSALAGAIGVALAWKGARQSWGESVALVMGWIMALYPESLLVGSSQIREPFLILFIAMAFWGVVDWLANRHRTAWLWLAGSLLGMVLFSPGVVVAALVGLGVWVWLREKERRISWWWVAGVAVVVVLAALLLGEVVGGTLQVPGGPLANLVNWLRYSANYSAYVTERNSGWLQTIFSVLPEPLHLPFITGYGIAQPVLPAAIADPAVWPMRALGILRGLGWYALLPFLLYSLRSIWKIVDKRERLAWLWLWLVSWAWIIISAARAGGDQWDNPRYRVILLLFQAALAAQVLTWQRATRDRWLGRILAVEGVFLVLFGYWYFSRYAGLGLRVFHIFFVFAAIAVISAAILIGGWLWDRRQVKRG